jgi:hypothetical protein
MSLMQKHINDEGGNDKNFFIALDKFYKKVQSKNKFLVIIIDEFGKVLEHAAKNNPERKCIFYRNFVSM